MEKIFINGGTKRYLSELDEFKNELPFGVIQKTRCDVGGTYVAANCPCNYIIVCPFRDLVDSIYLDKNNKYPVFKCYGGITERQFKKYAEENEIKKIAVTYDSLPKLVNWIGDVSSYKLLIDEYHLILEDVDFRTDAITNLINEVKKFNHYSFLSATPIDIDYEIDFLKELPHYVVTWEGSVTIKPIRYKTTKVNAGLARFIQIFLTEGLNCPDINGNLTEVKELYIFINSVTSIQQIVSTLELSPDEVKICCADRIRNRKILDEYEIEPVSNPNKKINFFTKKCFQGCNLFTNNGLVIVASDAYKAQTLTDISTTMEQIAGRIRVNDEYQNVFRHTLIHLYSTNNRIMDDEEFAALMEEKELEAQRILSSQEKLTKDEWETLIKKRDFESDIVSIVNGKAVYNPLKKQSFIYKQDLRKLYKNGFSIREAYDKSEKFEVKINQENWDDFDIKMKKAVIISYESLVKEYLANPSEQFELEYPEFKDYKRYLKESEMNTLRWNKEKMMKAVADKKIMNKVYDEVYSYGFVSSKELKERFAKAFSKYGIGISPKATLIEDCNIYSVTKTSKRIDGKKVAGYELNRLVFNLDNI